MSLKKHGMQTGQVQHDTLTVSRFRGNVSELHYLGVERIKRSAGYQEARQESLVLADDPTMLSRSVYLVHEIVCAPEERS